MTNHKQTNQSPYVVTALGAADRPRILDHLLALDDTDRALRFGVAADADALARYVASIDFERDAVFGAAGVDGALDGFAHVALHDGVAELGVSVVHTGRRRGLAGALAAAALRVARDADAREFRFHAAASNDGMRLVARRLGMSLEFDGSEFTARRALSRRAAPGGAENALRDG
jgi:GNAT superfamily N-acetyltransferase